MPPSISPPGARERRYRYDKHADGRDQRVPVADGISTKLTRIVAFERSWHVAHPPYTVVLELCVHVRVCTHCCARVLRARPSEPRLRMSSAF